MILLLEYNLHQRKEEVIRVHTSFFFVIRRVVNAGRKISKGGVACPFSSAQMEFVRAGQVGVGVLLWGSILSLRFIWLLPF